MSKQTFTTGQVLTAAQVNSLQANDYNQTVSVKTASYTLAAADKGTRIEFNTSGSVTCTVNSGLFDAGDTLVIQNRGAGVVTVTAGTATVNTSATLALSQYDAGTLYFVSDSAAIFFNTDAGGGSPLTTKGDLYGFSTVDARIPIGANDTVLTADSSQSLGLKWATPAGGAPNLTLLNSGGTALSGNFSVTISGISNKSYFVIYVNGASTTGTDQIAIRFNADDQTNYKNIGLSLVNATMESVSNTSNIQFPIGTCGSASSSLRASTFVFGGATSGIKYINSTSALTAGANTRANAYSGFWDGAAVTSISIVSESNNFDGGTVFIYGA